jgi:hypothetical protein
MPTVARDVILFSAARNLSEPLKQTISNPILSPINTETRKSILQLSGIFSAPTKPPDNTQPLPRVDTTSQSTSADGKAGALIFLVVKQ